MIRITNNVYLGKAGPASNGGGSGGEYTEGAGIIISGGQISLDPYALNDVTQIVSSGAVARGGNGSGGYFYLTQDGATMGVSGTYRVSAGDSSVNIRNADNAMVELSGQQAKIYANSRLSISCAATATQILAGGQTGTYMLVSRGDAVYIKHSSDYSRQVAVHVGMSATSDSMGITRPDNSTMIVNGGIMSVNPPETLWTSGNSGSEITYSGLSGGSVLRTYSNGLLMQSGAEYTIADGGVVSFTNPVESSDKIAFEYYPAAAAGTRSAALNSLAGGAKGLTKGLSVQEPEQEQEPETETEEPEQEEKEEEEKEER